MKLAERALRGVLEGRPGPRLKGWIELRRLLIRLRDPLVRYRVGQIELLLPLSHELPLYRNDHPLYDTAIARIAAQTGGPIVDVGANVGDTAAAIRARSDAPILCVEGDERFFELLERNAPHLEPVELERAFVESPPRGRVERRGGTARIVAGDDELPSKSLARVLEEHPRFAEAALLKVDADGMDTPIVLAALDLLARVRPVLFFEYDPDAGAEPVVFERLRDAGYTHMHVYENTGEHAATVELPGAIHAEYAGHGGARYADVCVFAGDLEP